MGKYIPPSTDLNHDLRAIASKIDHAHTRGVQGSNWYTELGNYDLNLRDTLVSIAKRIQAADENAIIGFLTLACGCQCHTSELEHPDKICHCQR